MKRLLITVALSLAPALALPGDHASFHLSFSTPPTLAVIQPGVQVVVDHDDEVFYADHHYWVHRGADWYRARHHSHAFAYVEHSRVPSTLLSLEPGHYRHYRPAGGGHSGHDGDDIYSDHADHGHGRGGHGGGHMHGH